MEEGAKASNSHSRCRRAVGEDQYSGLLTWVQEKRRGQEEANLPGWNAMWVHVRGCTWALCTEQSETGSLNWELNI